MSHSCVLGSLSWMPMVVRRNHFEKREGMKVGGMFKSPMTIILVLSMIMMVFLPKMMENLDPEQLEVSHVDEGLTCMSSE